jgi:hypothetical protein
VSCSLACAVPVARSSAAILDRDIGGDWGTPKAFTLTPGPREASTDSFLDHRPLELGKHAHHLEHRLAGGCRGVEALLIPLRAGTTVPSSVRVVAVPPALIEIYPQWRGHMYFVIGDQIILIV